MTLPQQQITLEVHTRQQAPQVLTLHITSVGIPVTPWPPLLSLDEVIADVARVLTKYAMLRELEPVRAALSQVGR